MRNRPSIVKVMLSVAACKATRAALRIAGAMKDCLFENIRTFDDAGALLVNDATVDIAPFFKN